MKHFDVIFVIVAGMFATLLGTGFFTFFYADGHSYFSDDPRACVNCHIMQDQYESWKKSSHARHTTCNSCHAPENFLHKYISKAENGFNHAFKFTFGNFNDPIQIRRHNFSIAMKKCLSCHGALVESTPHQESLAKGRSCMKCHSEVGHTH